MGIPLWESPPNANTLDKASATNRCEIHSLTHSSTSSGPSSSSVAAGGSSSGNRDRSGSSLPYDYIYSGSRPIRRHFLDSAINTSTTDAVEVDDLHNEREHEGQIRERERERDRDREMSARLDRAASRRERASATLGGSGGGSDRRPSHMERFLNANYLTPPLPTTSTSSQQRTRPHMIQPNTENALATALNDFLRENPPTYTRTTGGSGSGSNAGSNTVQSPSAETSALQQWLGLRGSSSNGTRTTSERRDPSWERALASAGLPTTLTPATTAVSTSNAAAAATISNPTPSHRRLPTSAITSHPSDLLQTTSPTSPSVTTRATGGDSFQTLVSQIRRIGALQDYMLNSVDETAASLEESLSLHSQALSRAAATTSAQTQLHLMNPGTADINSQNYYTSLRVREARIRTMQSRIELLANEFALLRTTRRELRRAEAEAVGMFQQAAAAAAATASPTSGTGGIDIPTTTTITSISAVVPTGTPPIPVMSSTTTAISAPAIPVPSTSALGGLGSGISGRTEVDEVHDALDAEGNSTHRRFLRSTFLPALDVENSREDAWIMQHLERAEERARIRERERERERERLRGAVL